MPDVTTIGSYGPTDATPGGSTWYGAPGTPATTAIATMGEVDSVTTSTNGVDCLTVTIPETGLYLLSGYILITQASDAATSHAVRVSFAYTTIVAELNVNTTTLDAKNVTTSRSEHFVALCAKGTTATVAILPDIVGSKTVGVGKYKLAFAITKLF